MVSPEALKVCIRHAAHAIVCAVIQAADHCALCILHAVCRPVNLENSRMISPRPGQPATLASSEGVGSLLVKGTTFATDAGDLTLPWLTDLAHFFIIGGAQGVAEGLAPDPPVMTWNVALQDVAVRYEPQVTNTTLAQQAQHAANGSPNLNPHAVSAILTLSGLQWQTQPEDEDQRILLQCLGLQCAESASRQGDWTPSHPLHVPAMQLARSGYSLIAQEFRLVIALTPPSHAESGFFQTEICNQRLSTSLTQTQVQLLSLLMSQWTGHARAAAPNSKDESGSAGSSAQDLPQLEQRGSEPGTVEWQGVRGEGQLRVMDGVQEDAFTK